MNPLENPVPVTINVFKYGAKSLVVGDIITKVNLLGIGSLLSNWRVTEINPTNQCIGCTTLKTYCTSQRTHIRASLLDSDTTFSMCNDILLKVTNEVELKHILPIIMTTSKQRHNFLSKCIFDEGFLVDIKTV